MTEEVNRGTDERYLVSGWQGRFFEEFTVGEVYKHPYGRTLTETDNVWLTNVTMNLNPLHFNKVYANKTEYGERLINGLVVIATAVGMSVIDISQNANANLGYDEVRHHAPMFHGDTLFAESEILNKRESNSRDEFGIVETELRGYNQNGTKTISLKRTPMVLKREYTNSSPSRPPGWPKGVGTQAEDLS